MEAVDVRGLLGLLLADGYFAVYRSPTGGYVQLTLTAGANESAFLAEKAEEFKRFCPTSAGITPYRTRPRPSGLSSEVLRFRVSTNKLRPIYNMLYPRGERCITQMVLDILGARAAAWLWAEGARPKRNGTVTLARVGFTEPEALIVQRWLAMLTGASSELNLSMVRPRLDFDQENSSLIRAALRSYAPATRAHLFQEKTLDRRELRLRRTRELPRGGQDPSGPDGLALPGDPAQGDRLLLS